jgi:LytS/YehU family sensor histidine kinase
LPWNKRRSLRFFVEWLSGLIIFLSLSALFYLLYISRGISLEQESYFWDNYWDGAGQLTIILRVLIYIYSLVNFSLFSYNQYSVVQIESLRHERNQLNLQFQALKSQLNPHFLFNALNNISALSSGDIKQAENYIRKLAETYKYILITEKKKLVTLNEELEMVAAFFYMEEIKYEDWINLDINISGVFKQTYIPPLTLQLLVENALKHNVIDEGNNLNIEISADESGIWVKNNCPKHQEHHKSKSGNKSFQIGLENIKKRYRYFSKEEIKITSNSSFVVRLPLIVDGE